MSCLSSGSFTCTELKNHVIVIKNHALVIRNDVFLSFKKKNHISVILYKGGKSKDGAIILVQFFFKVLVV